MTPNLYVAATVVSVGLNLFLVALFADLRARHRICKRALERERVVRRPAPFGPVIAAARAANAARESRREVGPAK
jgi:hypothetical protein